MSDQDDKVQSDDKTNLSKDMLEELLSDAATTANAEAPPEAASENTPSSDGCELFDWSQPTHFSCSQLDRLKDLFEKCCQGLAERVSEGLGAPVEVSVKGVQQRHYRTFVGKLGSDAFLFSLANRTGLPPGAFVVHAGLGLAWIERLLGGTDSTEEEAPAKLSQLDESLLNTVAGWVVDAVCRTMADAPLPAYALREGLVRPDVAVLDTATDEIVVIELAFGGPAGTGSCRLALPVAAVDPLCGQADDEQQTPSDPARDRENVESVLGMISVEMRVRLGHGELTLEEIINLEIGDVIVLDNVTDQAIPLDVDGIESFAGMPGLSEGNYAMQITRQK